MLVEQVRQEGDRLDGLPQSHLISKDNTVAPEEEEKDRESHSGFARLCFLGGFCMCVCLPAPGVSQPVQPIQLIISQLQVLVTDVRRLFLQSNKSRPLL